MLGWQKVECHHLTSGQVLLHVAMENPNSWILNLEANDGPTPSEQADHIRL